MSSSNPPPAAESIAVGYRGAAAAIDVSVRTVKTLVARGEIRSFRCGRRRLMTVDELRRWAAERQAAEMEGTGA